MSDCIEWTGSKTKNGYGTKRVKGKITLAHRWVVEQIDGPIPRGKVVMHLCHNRACYRYEHLRVGTQSENLKMSSENMRRDNVVGETNPAAKLTNEQVRAIFGSSESQTKLADAYGVSQATVSGIKTGANWKHITQGEQS